MEARTKKPKALIVRGNVQLHTPSRPVELPPGRSNEGVRAFYHKRLQALVTSMAKDYEQTLKSHFKQAVKPKLSDAHPLRVLQKLLKMLGVKWRQHVNKFAEGLAEAFVTKNVRDCDWNFRNRLMRASFYLKFRPTLELKRLMTSMIVENTALIKDIPQRYNTSMTSMVVNQLVNGGDVSGLAEDLSKINGITQRRANNIARDQNNKCNRAVDRHRALACGIKQARWIHSQGGRHPRPDHMKAGKEGLVYDIEKGAKISGQYIQPGQLPNCSCVGRNIIPGVEEKPISKEFVNNYGAKLRREGARKQKVSDGRPPNGNDWAARERERNNERWRSENLTNNTSLFREDIAFRNSDKHHIDMGHDEVPFQHVRDVIRGTQRVYPSKTHANRVTLRRYKRFGFNGGDPLSNISAVIEHDNFRNPRVVTAYYCRRDPKGTILWDEDD